MTHMFSESGGVQEVLAVELHDGGQVAESLVSYQVELASPGDDVVAHFVILTAGQRDRQTHRQEVGRSGRTTDRHTDRQSCLGGGGEGFKRTTSCILYKCSTNRATKPAQLAELDPNMDADSARQLSL